MPMLTMLAGGKAFNNNVAPGVRVPVRALLGVGALLPTLILLMGG